MNGIDLDERKLKILKAVVEAYVETGEPVSSKALCSSLDFPVSSATIRNEMAELCELGFLEQPHTSAGRVPSHLGYRYYINKIMKPKPISEEEQSFIDNILYSSSDGPEHLLKGASHALAYMTRLTVVSTTPTDAGSKIRDIHLIQISSRTSMVVITTSSGLVRNKIFRCDEFAFNSVCPLFNVIKEKLCGMQIENITYNFIYGLARKFDDLKTLIMPVLLAIMEACQDVLESDVSMEGQTNLLLLPEYEIDNARRIMGFLDRRNDIVRLLSQNRSNDISVLIGSETDYPELNESSIIIANYSVSGKSYGSIGIIGPVRMNYSKAITGLKYLASTIEVLLEDMMDTD